MDFGRGIGEILNRQQDWVNIQGIVKLALQGVNDSIVALSEQVRQIQYRIGTIDKMGYNNIGQEISRLSLQIAGIQQKVSNRDYYARYFKEQGSRSTEKLAHKEHDCSILYNECKGLIRDRDMKCHQLQSRIDKISYQLEELHNTTVDDQKFKTLWKMESKSQAEIAQLNQKLQGVQEDIHDHQLLKKYEELSIKVANLVRYDDFYNKVEVIENNMISFDSFRKLKRAFKRYGVEIQQQKKIQIQLTEQSDTQKKLISTLQQQINKLNKRLPNKNDLDDVYSKMRQKIDDEQFYGGINRVKDELDQQISCVNKKIDDQVTNMDKIQIKLDQGISEARKQLKQYSNNQYDAWKKELSIVNNTIMEKLQQAKDVLQGNLDITDQSIRNVNLEQKSNYQETMTKLQGAQLQIECTSNLQKQQQVELQEVNKLLSLLESKKLEMSEANSAFLKLQLQHEEINNKISKMSNEVVNNVQNLNKLIKQNQDQNQFELQQVELQSNNNINQSVGQLKQEIQLTNQQLQSQIELTEQKIINVVDQKQDKSSFDNKVNSISQKIVEVVDKIDNSNQYLQNLIDEKVNDLNSSFENQHQQIKTQFNQNLQNIQNKQAQINEEIVKNLENQLSNTQNDLEDTIKTNIQSLYQVTQKQNNEIYQQIDIIQQSQQDTSGLFTQNIKDIKQAIEQHKLTSRQTVQDQVNQIKESQNQEIQQLKQQLDLIQQQVLDHKTIILGVSGNVQYYLDQQKGDMSYRLDEVENTLFKKVTEKISDIYTQLSDKPDFQFIDKITANKVTLDQFELLENNFKNIKSLTDGQQSKDQIENIQKQLLLKANVKDMLSILERKCDTEQIHQVLAKLKQVIDTKLGKQEIAPFVSTQNQIWNIVQIQFNLGRWLWESGNIVSEQIPWELQIMNNDPENYIWEQNSPTIQILQAGVYYFELGIIGRDIRVHVYLHKTVLFTDNKKSNIKLSEFVYLQQRSIITVKLRGEAHKGSLVIQKYNQQKIAILTPFTKREQMNQISSLPQIRISQRNTILQERLQSVLNQSVEVESLSQSVVNYQSFLNQIPVQQVQRSSPLTLILINPLYLKDYLNDLQRTGIKRNWNQILQRDFQCHEAHFEKARIFAIEGMYSAAIEHLIQAKSIKPDCLYDLWIYTLYLYKEEAKDGLSETCQVLSSNLQAEIQRNCQQWALESYMLLLKLSIMIQRGYRSPEFYASQIKRIDMFYGYLAWIEIYMQQESNDTWHKIPIILKELIRLFPQKVEAYMKLWIHSYYNLRDYAMALNTIEKAYVIFTNQEDSHFILIAYAKTLCRRGKVIQGLHILQNGYVSFPHSPNILYHYGRLCIKAEKNEFLESAISALRVSAQNVNDLRAGSNYYWLAVGLLRQNKKQYAFHVIEKAIDTLTRENGEKIRQLRQERRELANGIGKIKLLENQLYTNRSDEDNCLVICRALKNFDEFLSELYEAKVKIHFFEMDQALDLLLTVRDNKYNRIIALLEVIEIRKYQNDVQGAYQAILDIYSDLKDIPDSLLWQQIFKRFVNFLKLDQQYEQAIVLLKSFAKLLPNINNISDTQYTKTLQQDDSYLRNFKFFDLHSLFNNQINIHEGENYADQNFKVSVNVNFLYQLAKIYSIVDIQPNEGLQALSDFMNLHPYFSQLNSYQYYLMNVKATFLKGVLYHIRKDFAQAQQILEEVIFSLFELNLTSKLTKAQSILYSISNA